MNTEGSQSRRLFWLDMLRLVAVVAVIVIHVSAPGTSQTPLDSGTIVSLLADGLSHWAVPMFVMISGALFLRPEKEINIRRIYTHYIPRLLVAYFFWWAVYAFIRVCVNPIEPGINVLSTRFLYHHYHLWFLTLLAAVYALIPLLRKIASDEKTVEYFLVVWAIYISVGFFNISQVKQISSLFVVNEVVGYSGYFMLGYWLSQKSFKPCWRRIIYIAGIAGAFITAGGTQLMCHLGSEDRSLFFNNLSLNMGAMASAIFLLIKENSAALQPKFGKFVAFTGENVFGIYLTHALWIFFYTDTVRSYCHPAIMIPLSTVVIFVLSLLTTLFLRKIPFLKKVVE